jgi:hypothetical protein
VVLRASHGYLELLLAPTHHAQRENCAGRGLLRLWIAWISCERASGASPPLSLAGSRDVGALSSSLTRRYGACRQPDSNLRLAREPLGRTRGPAWALVPVRARSLGPLREVWQTAARRSHVAFTSVVVRLRGGGGGGLGGELLTTAIAPPQLKLTIDVHRWTAVDAVKVLD